MLVIRRKTGESLLIGSEIEIEVIDLSPGRVKLGIHAPREIPILRKEVKLTAEQNRAASAIPLDQLDKLATRLRR